MRRTVVEADHVGCFRDISYQARGSYKASYNGLLHILSAGRTNLNPGGSRMFKSRPVSVFGGVPHQQVIFSEQNVR